jgi:hypothetical protein
MPLRCRGRYHSLRATGFPAKFFLSPIAVRRVSIPIEEIGFGRMRLPW